MISINIFGIIIDKFYYVRKFYLIIFLKIDKGLKIDFHYIIFFFSLVV